MGGGPIPVRKKRWWPAVIAVAAATLIVAVGAAFAFSGVFAKPTIEGKWTLTSQISTPEGSFGFADAELNVKDSKFELTVRKTGDNGKVLDMMSGDSMTFEGDCILESEGDLLVYGLTMTDFSTDVDGVPVENVAEYMNDLVNQFNTLNVKLKVPAKGLGSDYPQGEWGIEMTMQGMDTTLFADVQAQDAQSGPLAVGIEGGGSRMEAARGSWAKDPANPKSATFEFTQDSITAKIILTRQ